MKYFTANIVQQLIDNANSIWPSKEDKDPIVKLRLTNTNCCWLISELDPNDFNKAYGLIDLGNGFPELGEIDLKELEQLQTCNVLRRQRFIPHYPLFVYEFAAQKMEWIVTDERTLDLAALDIEMNGV